jgi:hypothetical protein
LFPSKNDDPSEAPDARVSYPDSEVDAFVPIDAMIDARVDAMPIDARPDAPPPCVPRSCSDVGASCGSGFDNGCGAPLTCGTCEAAAMCGGQGTADVCAIPVATRECANGWCWESPSPFAFTPTGVFARTASDVWMIGARGVIKHFDGSSWTAVSSNTVRTLRGIWMASATDGWIVGDAGTLLRWNGIAWASVTSGTANDIYGVHGASASNVWFVGDRITKRWNGSTLSTVGTTSYWFSNVFVTSTNKVFGAAAALIYENVSGTWTPRTSDTSGTLSFPHFDAIAGTGSSVYAVGGVSVWAGTDYEWVWHWNGSTWTEIDEPGNAGYGDAFVDNGVIYGSTAAQIWNMTTNAMTNGPANVTLSRTAGVGGEVFAPSTNGLPYRLQGGTWTAPPQSNINTRSLSLFGAYRVGDSMWFGRLAAAVEWNHGFVVHSRPNYVDWISGTGRDNVWALDRDSFNQLAKIDHFDGVRWSSINGPGVDANTIRATAQEVLVFGAGVFRLVGSSWMAETMPATANWSRYSDVGDDVYVVGMDYSASPYTPRIAKRSNGTWSSLPAPTTNAVCGIAAIAANDIWVTGQDTDASLNESATISHWDGVAWTTIKPAGVTNACSIVAANGEVWVGGTESGLVLHRAANGTWTTISGTATGDIRGLAFDSSGTLWAAGDDGVIMHR